MDCAFSADSVQLSIQLLLLAESVTIFLRKTELSVCLCCGFILLLSKDTFIALI